MEEIGQITHQNGPFLSIFGIISSTATATACHGGHLGGRRRPLPALAAATEERRAGLAAGHALAHRRVARDTILNVMKWSISICMYIYIYTYMCVYITYTYMIIYVCISYIYICMYIIYMHMYSYIYIYR